MGVNELLNVVLSGGGWRETGKPKCSTTCKTLGPHDLIRVIVGALTAQALFWQHVGTPFKGWDGEQAYPIPSLLLSSFWNTFKEGGELGSKSELPTFPGYNIHTMIPIKSW